MTIRLNKSFSGKARRFGFSPQTIVPMIGSIVVAALICIPFNLGYIEFLSIAFFGTVAWMAAAGPNPKRFFSGMVEPPNALRARLRKSKVYFTKERHGSVD